MSDTIDQLKKDFPAYKDVPDDYLTVALAQKEPDKLEQDPYFKADYERLTKTVSSGEEKAPKMYPVQIPAGQEQTGKRPSGPLRPYAYGAGPFGPREDIGPSILDVGKGLHAAAEPVLEATGGTVVDLYNDFAQRTGLPTFEKDKPLIEPISVEERIGKEEFDKLSTVKKSLIKMHDAAMGFAAGLYTPKNIALGPVAGLEVAGTKPIVGAFAADIVSGLPEQAGELLQSKDVPEAAGALTKLGLGTFIAKKVVGHATEGIAKAGAPATASALEQQTSENAFYENLRRKDQRALYPETDEILQPVRPFPGEGEGQMPVTPDFTEVGPRGEPTGPEKTGPEIITHSAYKDAEGNIHTGANHPEILSRLVNEGVITKEVADSFNERESRNTPQFGFFTDLNRFITRGEAAKVATESGQNLREMKEGDQVHSDEIRSASDPKKTLGESPVEKGPGIIGFGGAIPAEFDVKKESPTSLKNKIVDKERELRGLPAAMQAARKTFGEVWDRAMRKLDENSTLDDDLVNELRLKPRAITDEEDAILLHRQVQLQNEYRRAKEALAQAHDDGRVEAAEAENLRVSWLSDKLLELYNVGKAVGTETARGLNARKMLANEDFTLESMEMDARAARGGAPLSEEERNQIKELSEEINKKQTAYDEYVKQMDQKMADLQHQLEHERMLKEAAEKAKPAFAPEIMKAAERLVAGLDKRADAARQRLRERMGRTTAGVDPTILFDLAEVGASHLAHAALDFTQWSAKMVDEFGDWVKPHLDEAFKASKEAINSLKAPAKVRAAMQPKPPAPTIDQLKASTADHMKGMKESGNMDAIIGDIQKLAKQVIASGITDRDAVLDAVHAIVQEAVPEMSRRDTQDAIANYGRMRLLPQDQVSKTFRDLKGQYLELSKLDDMAKGIAPKQTGTSRDVPSAEKRRLQKQVNEAKKKGGYHVTDPATQLRTTMQTIKTRLWNQIVDLDHQIKTRTKTIKNKTEIVLDDEAKSLREWRDSLKKDYDEMFKRELTDADRIKIAMKHLERQTYEYDKRIKSGDFSTKAGKALPETPELQAARAKRDAMRDQFDHLRDLDDDYQRQQQAKEILTRRESLQKSIDELERKIREKDVGPKPKEMARPEVPELEEMIQRREALNKQVAQMRKKPAAQKAAEALDRQIKALNKRIAEKEKQVASGKAPEPKPQQVSRPASPELEIAKQRMEELNRQLNKLRHPERTEEEIALAAMKSRMSSRIAELTDKLARGDFSPKAKRPPPTLDPEARRLRTELEGLKEDWREGLDRERYNQRGLPERAGDWLAKLKRFQILSSGVSLFKLMGAAVARVAISTPEEAMGIPVSAIVPRAVMEKAARQAGFNTRAEVKSIASTVKQGMKDAHRTLMKGKSELDLMYGERDATPPSWLDFWGRIHGMLKAPTKRAEFERSFEKRLQHAADHGVDITDEDVKARIGLEAYKDANRAIFLQDNMVTNWWKAGLGALERRQKATGEPHPIGKLAGTLARITLPIVKVPTNIVAETLEYAVGSVTGLGRLGYAMARGVDRLPPEEADAIMRSLKKGSLGMAALALGYYNPDIFGGYYQKGEKRKKEEAQVGGLRIYGHNVPSFLLHNPLLETLQIGATIRRVQDSKYAATGKRKGFGEGLYAAAMGIGEQIPFIRETPVLAKAMDPNQKGQFWGEMLRSMLVPQLLQQAAQWHDEDAFGNPVKRNPRDVVEELEVGIPGLRERVKKKQPK